MTEATFDIVGMDGSIGIGGRDIEVVNAIEDGSLITSVLSVLWAWCAVKVLTW